MHILAHDIWSLVACVFVSLFIANARGSYTFYHVVSGDTASSIAASHSVTAAALQLANPQLSDQDYELPGEVVQIPAACSDQMGVHLTVPGDTMVDIAKDYNVDLGCLEKANPQITDPSTLNPGDCIEIPTDCPPYGGGSSPMTSPEPYYSGSMTSSTSTSSWGSPSSTPCDTESITSTTSAPSLPPSGLSCTFTIMSSGGISCPAGQLSDGQIRLNGSYSPAGFSINNGQITDSSGRGCIITAPPETQFQCDAGKSPVGGFSINSNDVLSYSQSETFYACPATDTEYNVYINPDFGQKKCFQVMLTAHGCGTSSSSVSLPPTISECISPPITAPQIASTQTYTTTTTLWKTVTFTSISSCESSTSFTTWSSTSYKTGPMSSNTTISSRSWGTVTSTKNESYPCETKAGKWNSTTTHATQTPPSPSSGWSSAWL